MEYLQPWTEPPQVFVFGPGYDLHDNGGDYCPFVNREELDSEDLDSKMAGLKQIAEEMYRADEAKVGDFVTMCYGSRTNGSLVGYIIGRNGQSVSTFLLPHVGVEYMARRMVIPAHLVPESVNPLKFFSTLMGYSDLYATAIIALPHDSILLRKLNLMPVEDCTYVLTSVDDKYAMNTGRSQTGFSIISIADNKRIQSNSEYEIDDFGGRELYVSHDRNRDTWVNV